MSMRFLKMTAHVASLIFFAAAPAPILSAQDQAGMLGTWRDGLKFLDSTSSQDSTRAEQLLRLELRSPTTPIQAALGLGLFCAKRHDPAALQKILAGVDQKFAASKAEQALPLHRQELWVSLASENAELTNRRVESLIASLQPGVNEEEGWLSAFVLGGTLGMLDNNRSDSPIAAEDLHRFKQRLSSLSTASWKSAFVQAYESSRAKASQFSQRLDEIEEVGLDKAATDNTIREADLKVLLDTMAVDREAAGQLEKSNEARLKELNAERKRTEAELAKLNRESRTATPGHPGPEKPPPPLPNRFDIYVEPLTVIWETVTDSNGNRTQRQRTIQRSNAEMELERNERFRLLMIDYNAARAAYEQYAAAYRSTLAKWTAADKQRREKLSANLATTDRRILEIRQESERLRLEIDEANRILSSKNAELKKLQAQIALDSVVIPAIKDGKPASLFRPGHFDLFQLSREKRRLLEASP